MAIQKKVIWERDPHAEAKHSVLAGYYDAWYPIMLSTWPRLTVFDGYAGPGEYTKNEVGSPIIAMRRLLERRDLVDGRGEAPVFRGL
jgi:three-Cys-motif partner protein